MKISDIRAIDVLLILAIIGVFIYFSVIGVKVMEVEKRVEVEKTTDFQMAAEKINPSIVRVFAEPKEGINPLTAKYLVVDNKIYSTGTGFFVTENGHIATAAHVINDSNTIIVLLQNQQQVLAKIIKINKDADIAIIKIEAQHTPKVNFGTYDKIKIGEEVGFIGYPLNFVIPLLTKGTISGKGNAPMDINLQPVKVIIINSFVNKGNSGGPLFNINGEVIGIINARQNTNELQQQFIQMPGNRGATMTIGGVDPILLAVETYNRAVALIGNTSQIGIGISTTSDYIQELLADQK